MSTTNGTATTWGKTFTLEDLKRLEREIAAMPKAPWTLVAPDGRAWQSTEPRELLPVLTRTCYPLFPAGEHTAFCCGNAHNCRQPEKSCAMRGDVLGREHERGAPHGVVLSAGGKNV